MTDDASRLHLAFERIVSRPPGERELKSVMKFLEATRARYQRSPDEAARAVAIGEAPSPGNIDAVQHAAWTQVATLLMNLSEAITRT